MSVRPFTLALLVLAALALPLAALADGCQIAQVAELKVTMDGLRPLVAAKINGRDAKFIADSGAFFSIIGTASAAEYDLPTKPAPAELMIQGVGGRARASITKVKEFTLAGVPIHDVTFIVGGSEPGRGAVGLLGQNVWRLADVEYDLAHGVIRLLKPKGCDKAVFAYWAKPGEAYSVMDIAWATADSPHTTGTAYLNDKKIRVLFDTGASMSMLTLGAAARAGVKEDSPGVAKAGMWRGIGSRVMQTWIAPFDTFKIGDEEIRRTKLRFGGLDNSVADMLIGADFFLSHRVYVASSQRKLYFTYNGGPVFNLAATVQRGAAASVDNAQAADESADSGNATVDAAPDTTSPDEPTDAADFSRRGTAFAARRDFEHAIADLTRACELAPNEADYFYQRGRAYAGNRQLELAMTDFDRAIDLKPDNVDARVARATLRLARGGEARREQMPGVLEDLDKANAAADRDNDVHFELAMLYARAAALSAAIGQYDMWLDRHAEDSRAPDARAGRCRARALLGQDLDTALADCNRAVRARADVPFFRDSRGLVYLRMGEYDKSIADYDTVLGVQPRNAWALYGRGVARLRKGLTKNGEADIAASKQSAPAVAAQAERLGITP